MADQPQPQKEPPEQPPSTVKRAAPKQMELWDSFMLILRPDKGP